VSDWKMQYWHEGGKGVALSRGLRFQDLRYGNSATPGVCVLKQQDDVPKAPGNASTFGPIKEKQLIIDAVTKQLLQMGVVLTDPHHHGIAKEEIMPPRPPVVEELSQVSPSSSGSLGTLRGRARSEASLASHHERRKNLCSHVARKRYQVAVIAPPKKGHRFCEPEHK